MRISDWSSDVCSSDLQPISSLSTALGQITAADSLGIVGDAFGDFAGGAVHHGAPQAALRAESRSIGNRSSRRPSTSAPTAPVGTSRLSIHATIYELTPTHLNTTHPHPLHPNDT